MSDIQSIKSLVDLCAECLCSNEEYIKPELIPMECIEELSLKKMSVEEIAVVKGDEYTTFNKYTYNIKPVVEWNIVDVFQDKINWFMTKSFECHRSESSKYFYGFIDYLIENKHIFKRDTVYADDVAFTMLIVHYNGNFSLEEKWEQLFESTFPTREFLWKMVNMVTTNNVVKISSDRMLKQFIAVFGMHPILKPITTRQHLEYLANDALTRYACKCHLRKCNMVPHPLKQSEIKIASDEYVDFVKDGFMYHPSHNVWSSPK